MDDRQGGRGRRVSLGVHIPAFSLEGQSWLCSCRVNRLCTTFPSPASTDFLSVATSSLRLRSLHLFPWMIFPWPEGERTLTTEKWYSTDMTIFSDNNSSQRTVGNVLQVPLRRGIALQYCSMANTSSRLRKAETKRILQQ